MNDTIIIRCSKRHVWTAPRRPAMFGLLLLFSTAELTCDTCGEIVQDDRIQASP